MKARIQKWGNSLALRIPKTFAIEARLDLDTPVELSLSEGALVIRPMDRELETLEGLLQGVNESNLHDEQDLGPAMGREVW